MKFPILQPPSSSGAVQESVTERPIVITTLALPGHIGRSVTREMLKTVKTANVKISVVRCYKKKTDNFKQLRYKIQLQKLNNA